MADGGASHRPSHAPVAREVVAATGLRLLDVRCRATHHDRPYEEMHSAYTVSLVTRGIFTYRGSGPSRILSAGWMILGHHHDPFVCSHEHGQDEGDDCLALYFAPETFDAIRRAIGRRGPRRAFGSDALPPSPRIWALMRLLGRRDAADTSEVGYAIARSVLDATPDKQGTPAVTLRTAERDRVHAATQFIEREAGRALTLEAIAASVDLSPFHFLRLFRRVVGMTPHQYLVGARLRRAAVLLRDSELSVTRIAFESGYGDLSNFVRTFHRDVGCSPGAYRRGGAGHRKILQDPRR